MLLRGLAQPAQTVEVNTLWSQVVHRVDEQVHTGGVGDSFRPRPIVWKLPGQENDVFAQLNIIAADNNALTVPVLEDLDPMRRPQPVPSVATRN